MITFLTKDSKMERAKSVYANKIQQLMDEDNEFTWDIIDGHNVDILTFMVEVVSICNRNVQSNVAKLLTQDDIKPIIKPFDIKNYRSKNTKQDNDEDAIAISQIISSYFIGEREVLYSLVHTNKKIASYIVFEAVLAAQSNIASADEFVCMTYFSTMCCVINHWAIKKLSHIALFKGMHIKGIAIDISWKDKKTDSQIPDDAIDFLKQTHSQEAFSVAANFARNVFVDGKPENFLPKAVSLTIEEAADHIRKESKKYDHVSEILDHIKESLIKDSGGSSTLYRFIDKRHLNNCVYAVATTLCDLTGFGMMYHTQIIDTYAYLRYCHGEKILNIADDDLNRYIDQIVDHKRSRLAYSIAKFVEEFAILEMDRLNKSKCEANSLQGRLEANEEKTSRLSKDLRKSKKGIKELESSYRDLQNRYEKLEKDTSSKIKEADIIELKEKLNKCNARLNAQSSNITSLNRSIQKKDKEIEALKSKLEASRKECENAVNMYRAEKSKSDELAVIRMQNEVPIQSFINSIKRYRIALIGGDMMFNRIINDYELSNVKTYKAGCRNICYEDLSDMDLVVMATAFLDHSTQEGALNACRAHKIPILNFNNKNADMLIYSIFTELNK